MNKLLAILFLIFSSNIAFSQQPRYRFILPPAPPQPPALNNTVQSQIANQNINFNTGNSISGFGLGGGFNSNSGGFQGTLQYTQNNTIGMQISTLYQLPNATQFQNNFGSNGQNANGSMFSQNFNQFGNNQFNNGLNQNQFSNNGFNQSNNRMSGQPIGVDNPFYQMAMQGITAGVTGSAFQSGNYNLGNQIYRNGSFNQFGNNQFNNQFGFGQFNNNQFGNNRFGLGQFGFGGG